MRLHAREAISAQTNSAVPCASTRTVAAESAARTSGSDFVAVGPVGDVTCTSDLGSRFPQGSGYIVYFPTGNKDRSAGSTLAAQAASLWSPRSASM